MEGHREPARAFREDLPGQPSPKARETNCRNVFRKNKQV